MPSIGPTEPERGGGVRDHHGSRLDGGHIAGEDHHVDEGALTRRAALGAAGAGGLALLFAGVASGAGGRLFDALGPDVVEAAATTCVMTPAKTVGPYFVDEKLSRRDVRANTSDGAVQAGLPLTLRMQIFDADHSCAPVQGATVDIWHANAAGLYSDESANDTLGQNWLRGFQTTDANGLVTFKTIYPGWYQGRAVHIHFKVRVYDGSTKTLEFTSRMFFTDAMNTRVFTTYSPYKDRPQRTPDTTDATDDILGSDAATLTLAPVSDGAGGYTADFSVGVSRRTSQLDNDSAGGPGGGGPGGPGGAPPGTPTPQDTVVAATLKSAAMVRTTLGTRQLKVRIRARETVTLTARLVRGSTTVASRKVTLRKGTSDVRITIPSGTSAGAAKLTLKLKDGASNSKAYVRTVHVRGART